jgi:hypothetical protein
MRNENLEEKMNGFVSFVAKKFPPSFRFEAKITKSKRSEKFKTKRSEKIDMNFASLLFASKQKLLKRSEKFEAKRSEKIKCEIL